MAEAAGAPGSRTSISGEERPFIPGMSRSWLLPLYDPLTRLLGVRTVHRRLIDQARARPGQTVLEIGCGSGNHLLAAKQTQPAATVVGVDPDLTAPRRTTVVRRDPRRGAGDRRFR
jgi:hypothetical protein